MCGRGACQVCHKELPVAATDDSSAGVDPQRDLLLRPHIVGCASLRAAKEAIDTAMEHGSKMPCPECGLAGRKDEACTHMSCPRCHTPWCYVCGLSVRNRETERQETESERQCVQPVGEKARRADRGQRGNASCCLPFLLDDERWSLSCAVCGFMTSSASHEALGSRRGRQQRVSC